jgi:hypothetical protein
VWERVLLLLLCPGLRSLASISAGSPRMGLLPQLRKSRGDQRKVGATCGKSGRPAAFAVDFERLEEGVGRSNAIFPQRGV